MKYLALGAWNKPIKYLATVLTLLIVAGIASIGLDAKLVPGGFEAKGSESARVSELLLKDFKINPDSIFLEVRSPETSIERISASAVEKLKHVGANSVRLLASKPGARLLQATWKGSSSQVQARVPGLLREFTNTANAAFNVTGQPVFNFELNQYSVNDALRAEMIAAPLLFILLLLIYRRLTPVFITFAVAGTTLTLAKALGFALASVIPTSVLFANIVSMIGLAVSIDYVLFIFREFQAEVRNGSNLDEAVKRSFSNAGRTVIYSGLAVILGFAAILSSPLMPLRSIGFAGVIVIVCALLVTHTVLPSLMKLTSKKLTHAFETRRNVVEKSRRATNRKNSLGKSLITFALLLISLTPLFNIHLKSPVAGPDVLPAKSTASKDWAGIAQNFSNSVKDPIEIILKCRTICGPARVSNLEAAMNHIPGITGHGLVSFATGKCPNPQSDDNSNCRSQIAHQSIYSLYGANDPRTVEIVAQLRKISPDLLVGGSVATGIDFDKSVQKTLPFVFLIILVLGLSVFYFAFRSMRLALGTLGINLLVVGASLGLTAFALRDENNGVINSVTPVVLFAIIFGLTMDYLVYSVHAVQKHWNGNGQGDDIAEIPLKKIRGTLLGAATLMFIVFLAFLSADLQIVRELGIGLSIGVLLDTFVARGVLLPYILNSYSAATKRRARTTEENEVGGFSTRKRTK